FVAAENLFFDPSVSRRWVVSFCFGLVHGFGFSSALRELGLPAHGLLLSLLGFNVGVEVGQGLVVAACLPLLLLLRRTRWESRAAMAQTDCKTIVPPSPWGPNDQTGATNRVTPAVTKAAAAEIKEGKVIPLSHPLVDGVPLFGTRFTKTILTATSLAPGGALG